MPVGSTTSDINGFGQLPSNDTLFMIYVLVELRRWMRPEQIEYIVVGIHR